MFELEESLEKNIPSTIRGKNGDLVWDMGSESTCTGSDSSPRPTTPFSDCSLKA